MVASWVLEQQFRLAGFRHFAAKGYPSRKFGSQAFHRNECGIDGDSILQAILDRSQPVKEDLV